MFLWHEHALSSRVSESIQAVRGSRVVSRESRVERGQNKDMNHDATFNLLAKLITKLNLETI